MFEHNIMLSKHVELQSLHYTGNYFLPSVGIYTKFSMFVNYFYWNKWHSCCMGLSTTVANFSMWALLFFVWWFGIKPELLMCYFLQCCVSLVNFCVTQNKQLSTVEVVMMFYWVFALQCFTVFFRKQVLLIYFFTELLQRCHAKQLQPAKVRII